jgi:hypothetical protein
MENQVRHKFIVRYVKAYVSVLAVIDVVVAISELKGAGWRPALAGLPMYISLFILVTYAMVREFRNINKNTNNKK